jgi:hypothetical protein
MALGSNPVKAAQDQKNTVRMPYNPVVNIDPTELQQGGSSSASYTTRSEVLSPPPGPPAPAGLDMAAQGKLRMAKGGLAEGSTVADERSYSDVATEMQGTPMSPRAEDEVGSALVETAADLTPGVGEVRSALGAKKSYEEGDVLGTALGVVGAIPGVGTGIRGLKAAGKAFKTAKSADLGKQPKLIAKDGQSAYEALGLDEQKVIQWRKENKVSQRQAPLPDMEAAAEKLSKKEISSDEYRELSKKAQPIVPLKEVPKMPSFEDIAGALKENQVTKTGVVGVNLDIPAGTKVASRLDIPAYNEYDTWVVSLHDGTKKSGNAIGYAKTAVLRDVTFESDPRVALDIARRKELKSGERMGKATIARAFGDWVPHDPAKAREYAESIFNDPEWVQVGMNPYRASYFYDKADGMPVIGAEEVVQIGPLVLAKNVKKTEPNDAKFRIDANDPDSPTYKKGGVVMSTSKIKKPVGMAKGGFAEGGMLQEGGTVDPVSGNEVPPGALQEEVRDDIPAQLSEGEFVFPADVVRFIGLENLMKLRQSAKEGLSKMEAMGQMSNAEEATEEDDGAFESDIDSILEEIKNETNGN